MTSANGELPLKPSVENQTQICEVAKWNFSHAVTQITWERKTWKKVNWHGKPTTSVQIVLQTWYYDKVTLDTDIEENVGDKREKLKALLQYILN